MLTFEEWKAAQIAKDPALRRSTDTFLRQLYIAEGNADERNEAEARQSRLIDAVIVTTTPELPGCRIVRIIDIVTAECVFGMNVFRDMLAQLSDVFGGRSEATQRVLRDARTTCLRELRREAVRLGGNAIIGVDLDYSEFSGQGKSMLFLVASGTAVVVEDARHGPIEG